MTTPAMTTLLVDLNMADGVHVEVFLEPDTYVVGSPADPPTPGNFVTVQAEGGIRCTALVESVDGLSAVLKLDMSTWTEVTVTEYDNPFSVPRSPAVPALPSPLG